MTHIVKILFLVFSLVIISCDEDKISSLEPIYGCMNSEACNYNVQATQDNSSCELNLFCYDADNDGFGYGEFTQICLDEIPVGWVDNCDDDADDCDGERDDCGKCNGDNQDKDCMGICFGINIEDDIADCCDNVRVQSFSSADTVKNVCLPEEFKWSLEMTATMGEYNNGEFIPLADPVFGYFTLGTHYLSTDSLDLLIDIVGDESYNDIAGSPNTNPIFLYTYHPEWNYFVGDKFIREYKKHNIDKILSDEGIFWNGITVFNSGYYGEKYIKIDFELDSGGYYIDAIGVILNFDDYNFQSTCNSELFLSTDISYKNHECNITGDSFEYIYSIPFSGQSLEIPFYININNLYLSRTAMTRSSGTTRY